MSETTSLTPVEPEQALTGKRGLDITKVDFVMSREQERDLTFLYRVDQLKLFDENAKTYHRCAKPGDVATVQILFEMRDLYLKAKEEGDLKSAISLMKQMDDIIARTEARRDKALERLLAWKKHAEAAGMAMDDATSEDLEKIANR